MIELTYKNLNDPNLPLALQKLKMHEGWKDAKLMYNISKICRRFDSELAIAQELYLKLVKEYAVLNEDGSIKPSAEDKPGTFLIPDEKADGWEKAIADFESVKFEMDCVKIPLSKLENVKVSAADVEALEFLLDVTL